ncbi:MAG: class I SAM-dependent methyltransferase [Chitinispirillia bacterium]
MLHTDEYKRIHSDDSQLDSLLRLFEVKENGRFLDFGTGNGYVGFELAKRNKNCYFIGVDITVESIARNNEIAKNEKVKNIEFISYDGFNLPFESQFFDGGISRYAFHHFPDIEKSVEEIGRIINTSGFFILSDPKTYGTDTTNFIDNFQRLKPDGHVHFYQEKEIDSLFQKHGFIKETSFQSFITYPRELDMRYQALLDQSNKKILEEYKIRVEGQFVYITVECMNSFYRKIQVSIA